ncbi:hypothetical protein TWF106_009770 [Orbilia oligospora]|uniref:Uncharacterized protein n=1 Tax=Orbilia oligospora TaxID=2813651 RepID=A0A7C8QI01_ORBOL|nr:hypothetical protein TWF106_009770 [Orbilia oligospora]
MRLAKTLTDYQLIQVSEMRALSSHLHKGADPRSTIMPALTSLISLSAPSMLLSMSLFTFLTGIGIYLGFLYTKNVDSSSMVDDNRNVFVVYIIALGVCGFVYYVASSVSAEVRDSDSGFTIGNWFKLLSGQDELEIAWKTRTDIIAAEIANLAAALEDREN